MNINSISVFFCLFLTSLMTGPLHAATVTQRVPLLYSSTLNKALVVAIADSGNYWFSECDVTPDDTLSLSENLAKSQNLCRRLREIEFPLADIGLSKAIESFSDSFYKESVLNRARRGSSAPFFLGFAAFNALAGVYFFKMYRGSSVYYMPFIMAGTFGILGLGEIIGDALRSPPNVTVVVESVISKINSPQTPQKIARAMSEDVYKTYRESLSKAIDTVGTDYSKALAPR